MHHRSARGHRLRVPEVTFASRAIACLPRRSQHGGMRPALRPLLQPLNLAAIVTVATVGLVLQHELGDKATHAWALLGVFVLALLALDHLRSGSRLHGALLLLQAGCAFALVVLAPRSGVAPVLLIILIAELVMVYPLRVVLPLAAVLNGLVYLLLVRGGHGAPWLQVVLYAGFQMFAALTTWYARTAEEARDRLAAVNADLLATRSLLADSIRDRERLRVARELHDVIGHKLTALTLNLRVLAADLPPRQELQQAGRLAGELLGDIRRIVHAVRDDRGFDLATALRALAAPLPRPQLDLHIEDDVHVADPDTAEALLRLVQEAMTNSARHTSAARVRVSLSMTDGGIHVGIEDDGRLKGPLCEGSGLGGMRERIHACGGRIAFGASVGGALRIDATLPTAARGP
ncbi:sensor histidine kinase [Marilutibacter chinensis]|uniref:Histidine kinase n=1 Tax=Marilutibacter chinensis TaxID=2912247 RepID=A0ABS9HZ45_9GAMM|nr:histidine kinase [Lysobacter chinensis]MCF7223635.1 histidine kinase [Lysobacter chinensis]